jgi:oxygen-independent coproporphyrinogen-3 oxidase
MDRIHTPGEAVDALQDARRAGYATFSADLMFGLPGQSKATWRADLEALLELQPPHLSVYNLMVEPGTPLHLKVRDGKVRLPSEPTQLRMMEDGWQILAERGYAHYEISNFAKPGHESVHNTLYWSGRPYLGVGAGAHSFVPAGPGGAALALRKAGVRKFGEYIARALDRGLGAERFFAMQEEVSAELHLRERMMTGLRLKDGLDVEDVQAVTGIDPRQAFGAVAGRLAQQGLLQIEGARWRLLEGTWPVSDAIFAQFFGD